MAAGALVSRERQFYSADRRAWSGTPEIYFTKSIDNSRLVKVADPRRRREMIMLTGALMVLLVVVIGYVWQHFAAIECGYRIEAMKSQRGALAESNAALRLEEASLKDPERIDLLAREMGLQAPQAGQVMRLEAPSGDLGVPVLAQATPQIFVVSPAQ